MRALNKMEKQRIADYKLTGELTTILCLFANIYKDAGMEETTSILSDINAINMAIASFNTHCWPDIKVQNDMEENISVFKMVTDKVTMYSMCTAGRILMTIRPNNSDLGKFVSIIGVESMEDNASCGMQGIAASKDECIYLIQNVIENWGKGLYKVSDEDISIS